VPAVWERVGGAVPPKGHMGAHLGHRACLSLPLRVLRTPVQSFLFGEAIREEDSGLTGI